jgi:hypothetical protein
MTKFAIQTADITLTQESLHVEITNVDSAPHFSLISRVLFAFNPFHNAKQSTRLIIRKYWSCA